MTATLKIQPVSGSSPAASGTVTKQMRASQKTQRPCVLWFTGLPAAGKTTTASALDRYLFDAGYHSCLLDGDALRTGLSRDLDFSQAGRHENIRRAGEVAKICVDAGLIVLVALVSPLRNDRQMARQMFADDEFIEIFVDTPPAVCEGRDPKGLYRRARSGEIECFTGVSDRYEMPQHPEIRIDTLSDSPDIIAGRLINELATRKILRK